MEIQGHETDSHDSSSGSSDENVVISSAKVFTSSSSDDDNNDQEFNIPDCEIPSGVLSDIEININNQKASGLKMYPRKVEEHFKSYHPDILRHMTKIFEDSCTVVVAAKSLQLGPVPQTPSGVLVDLCVFSVSHPVHVLTLVHGLRNKHKRHNTHITQLIVELVHEKLTGDIGIVYGALEMNVSYDAFQSKVKQLRHDATILSFEHDLAMTRAKCWKVICCLLQHTKSDQMDASGGKGLNILLVGKTGHGKSATANSILQDEVFATLGGGDSVTTRCGISGVYFEGRQVTVVDTPGTMDTGHPDDAYHHLAEALEDLKDTIDAFVLVLNYKTRMTEEERNTIEKFKQFFRPEAIGFMAVVFTHGDNFREEKVRNDDKRTFAEFLQDNGGKYLNEFLATCGNRYVLFDNYAEGKDANKQIRELVTVIDEMTKANKGERYQSNFLDVVSHVDNDDISNDGNDSVKAGGGVKVGDSVKVYDSVKVGDSVKSGGGVKAGGDVKVGDSVIAGGGVKVYDSVKVGANVKVDDGLKAGIQPPTPSTSTTNRNEGIAAIEREMRKKGSAMRKKSRESGDGECFPADAFVIFSSGLEGKMENLKVGDKVLTMCDNFSVCQTEVYLFGHALKDYQATFVCLKTATRLLKVTEGHYVYTFSNKECTPKPAKDVIKGDILLTLKEGRCVPEEVRDIWWSEERGLYAPFTMSGSVIVGGVLASCYVDMMSAEMAHCLLWPVRKMYKMSPTTLRVVSKSGERGIPGWIDWILKANIL